MRNKYIFLHKPICRMLAIAHKELRHVTRDMRTLFLVTIAPAFLLLILAYVFSFDAEHFDLVVLDQDKSALSHRYVADLTGDGTFRVVGYIECYEEIDTWLQASQAHAALIIPPGTADRVQAHRPAPIQAIFDGVDAIAANQALGQLRARTQAFARSLSPTSLEIRNRAWYNPSLKSLTSMVPGLIAVVLYMPALALSLALTREKELGSFEGLAATPVQGIEYLAGKMLTYAGFGLLSLLPVMLVATLWFRIPFQGNLFTLLTLSLCFFLASFGVSLVIANLTQSQQAAMLIMIMVFFVPSFFLAGLIMPIDTHSPGVQLVTYALPATHFILICRGLFLKGLSLSSLLTPTLALLGIAGATLTLSLARFNKWVN